MSEPLLPQLESPAALRELSPELLPHLAAELRAFILDVVSVNPGHLGSSLGAVELSIALHYLFDTPDDLLVWDVGHQAYAHKILTGRRNRFDTLRRWKGISGFPSRKESLFDSFGTGHASTGLSAALGMAVASLKAGEHSRQHLVVVGDGAITGGMFFEALNQAGGLQPNLLIVLNDNGISIDQGTGAIREHLKMMRSKARADADYPLFNAFNIPCFGPVDGNNFDELLPALEKMKAMQGTRMLHVVTTKGKGFERAEKEQVLFHAPGAFDRITGQTAANQTSGEATLYQHIFGETLSELATLFPEITGITPAMPTGSSLNIFMESFPERAFDVDIAEQHALTFAAGQASRGLKPFCVIYSTFLQRAYDQLIHDIALQNLPVTLCVDRAGLVGEDGATHHGAFDLAFLRCIPNLVIAAPMDACELRNLMYSAALSRQPYVIRYPRGKIPAFCPKNPFAPVETGKGRLLRKGETLAVASIGHAGNFVAEALDRLQHEGINVSHYDLRFLKPLDNNLLQEVFLNHQAIVTVEDGVIDGGMGSALLEWASCNGHTIPVKRLGIPDEFIPQGTPEQQHDFCGFGPQGIYDTVKSVLNQINHPKSGGQ